MPLSKEDADAFASVLTSLGVEQTQVNLVIGVLTPVLDSFSQTVTKKAHRDQEHKSLLPLLQAHKKRNRVQKVIEMNQPTPLTKDNLALKEQPSKFLFSAGYISVPLSLSVSTIHIERASVIHGKNIAVRSGCVCVCVWACVRACVCVCVRVYHNKPLLLTTNSLPPSSRPALASQMISRQWVYPVNVLGHWLSRNFFFCGC